MGRKSEDMKADAIEKSNDKDNGSSNKFGKVALQQNNILFLQNTHTRRPSELLLCNYHIFLRIHSEYYISVSRLICFNVIKIAICYM